MTEIPDAPVTSACRERSCSSGPRGPKPWSARQQALRHLAELGALDLEAVGRGRLGEVVDREDAQRHLVVGEPALAMGDDRRFVERGAGLQDHERYGTYALGPRHGDDLAVGDGRQ